MGLELRQRSEIRPSQTGAGAISILVALLVMGAMAAIVIAATSGSSPSVSTGGRSPSTLSASPLHGASNIQASQVAACEADYQAVSTAVDAYQAENGRPPDNISQVTSFLKNPPTSSAFTINVIAGGNVQVASPGHTAATGDSNCRYASG